MTGKLSKAQIKLLEAAGLDVGKIPASLKAGNGGGALSLETKYSFAINQKVNECRKIIHGEPKDGKFTPKILKFKKAEYKVSVYVRKLKSEEDKPKSAYEEQIAFEEKYTEPEDSE